MIGINYLGLTSGALIVAGLKGAFVLGTGVAIVALMGRSSAALRYAVLTSVLGAALILPVMSIVLPRWVPFTFESASSPNQNAISNPSKMERTPVELVPSLGLVDSEATGASLNGAVNAF